VLLSEHQLHKGEVVHSVQVPNRVQFKRGEVCGRCNTYFERPIESKAQSKSNHMVILEHVLQTNDDC
jgi:hypothetical protein